MNDGHNAALEKIPQIQIDFQVHLEYVSDSTLDMHFMHEFMCLCYLSISSTIMHLLHVCVCESTIFAFLYIYGNGFCNSWYPMRDRTKFRMLFKITNWILIQSASILCMWAYTNQKNIEIGKIWFYTANGIKITIQNELRALYLCASRFFFFCVAPVCHVLAIVLHFVAKL